MGKPVIIAGARTPIGRFGDGLFDALVGDAEDREIGCLR